MMAVFVISLEDEVSKPALVAAAGVRSLADEFAALQKSMTSTSTFSSKDIEALQQKNLAGHDSDRDAAIGLKKQQEAAAETSKSFADLTASGNKWSESLTSLGLQAEQVFSAMAPYVKAAGAVIGWFAEKLFDASEMAIRLTQEKQQLQSVFDVFTGGGGGALLDEIEDLAATLPYTADKLNAWAKGLLAAGIQGDALKTSIRAIASATAIMGEAGGAAAEGLIKRFAMMAEAGQKVTLDRRILSQLASAGVSVAALAKQLGVTPDKLAKMQIGAKELGDAMQKALIAQGEGPLSKLGNTWATISAKLREGFEDAFEDLGEIVEPFMKELASLAGEFYAGGVAANDWKAVIKTALTSAFQAATQFVNWMHRGFLHVQIAILQVRIAIKPLTNALGSLVSSGTATSAMLFMLKWAVVAVLWVVGLLALAVLLFALPFIIAAAAIWFLGNALYSLAELAYTTLMSIKQAAIDAGWGLISGLANAISGGSPWVIGLVAALAAGIIGAIVGPLQIHSPSRVMMRLGNQTTAGLAMGIDAGVPAVEAAAQGAGAATVTSVQAGANGAPGATGRDAKGKGGGTIVVEAGAIVIHGAGGDIMALTEEALALLLERVRSKAGL